MCWKMSTGAAALLAPGMALGQGQGTGQWISEVMTQDGDAIVEPGETATVSLWMDMEPSVGEKLPDGTKLFGFGGGSFDIIGSKNAEMGTILGWELNENLAALGDMGTSDGISIFDVVLVQLHLGPFDDSDPIFLLSYEWQPREYKPFEAVYEPFVEGPDGDPGFLIWKNDGSNELWAVDDVLVPITVVPASSTGLVLVMLCHFALSKHRRSMYD